MFNLRDYLVNNKRIFELFDYIVDVDYSRNYQHNQTKRLS